MTYRQRGSCLCDGDGAGREFWRLEGKFTKLGFGETAAGVLWKLTLK